MSDRSLAPSINVTIGQHTRVYFAFVTTAPITLDSPATVTLHGGAFSELAGFGRAVPLVYCRSDGAWAALEWALRRLGVIAWLRGEAQRRYAGRVHPLTVLQYYLRTPRRVAVRQFKRLTPGLFRRTRTLMGIDARPDA